MTTCDHRCMPVSDLRHVLRALAEVRDAEFYSLWVLLTRLWKQPLPDIEFRIYQMADSAEAHIVVCVDGTRPDGTEVNWGLTVTTADDKLIVDGSVGVRGLDSDGSEAFRTSADTSDPEQAARLIHAIAAEVCSQRKWLSTA
jgi:hypothetical protein